MSPRRTIDKITWYDPPDKIYNNVITAPGWPYRYQKASYKIRDISLMFILYISCARITELLGGKVLIGDEIKILEPVTRDQFVIDERAIWLRHLPIIKQRFASRGSRWVPVLEPRDYPERVEIPFFKDEKPFSKFTNIVADYLETIPSRDPIFKIGRGRAHIICSQYGYFPHYLRDMGLKLWRRYFKNNSFKLKNFSGHKRWSSLERYMKEDLYGD